MPTALILSSGLPWLGEINPWWGLTLGLFLVIVNGFFVAAEFALVKVRPTQLEPYVESGNRRGKLALSMVENLDAYLSACQVGITLASLALGWVGEPAFSWIIGPAVRLIPGASDNLVHTVSLTLAFVVITVLHIVVGEMAPKSMAIRKAEPTALWIALPLFAFYKVTYPAIWALNGMANASLKLVGLGPASEEELGHDEAELRLLLASSHATHLSTQKRRLLDNIFELSHRMARQIMVPRADVIYLNTQKSPEENLELARESGHTRFPLCEGDLDHVVGLIHIKDVFRAGRSPERLEELAREIAYVPETLGLDRLLKRMRAEKVHLAAVLDEYGGVSGVVSLENVIEEIVGPIQDEFDAEEPELVKESENTYVVSGGILIDDLERTLGLELSDRNEDTVGGVVLSEIGRRPLSGDTVRVGPVSFEVLKVQLNRIQKVRARILEEAEATGKPNPTSTV